MATVGKRLWSATFHPASLGRTLRIKTTQSWVKTAGYATQQLPHSSRSTPALIATCLFGLGLGVAGTSYFAPGQSRAPTVQYASKAKTELAAREIAKVIGDDSVSFDSDQIETHGFSDWSSCNTTGRAVAIVYPTSTEDVSKIASICHEHNVVMVPYGAGSSTEGNFASPYGGIVIDFAFMDKIVALHADDMDVVVQPGVNWVDLNRKLEHEKLFLPLDPSPTATVGGMVSTNCSGTNAFRYGTMKDWVINVTAVLADGQVIKTRRRPRKSSAGYNLTSLFVGAEGTLGIVTEISLKLAVVPNETGVAVVSFPTITDATSAATKVIRSGMQLGALELMDATQMQIVNTARHTTWDETPTLFLKFSGPTKGGVQSDIKRLRSLIAGNHPVTYHQARNKQEEAELWSARKMALWAMTSIKPEGHVMWSTDVAVPISRLAEIIELSQKDGEAAGVFASIVGHVGDGNFHETMMYDPKDPAQAAAVSGAIHKMIERALEMDGTVSGEHAIGMGKMECLMDELGSDTINVMKSIKRTLDPKWLLNPGKIFELPENSNATPAAPAVSGNTVTKGIGASPD